MPDLTSGGTGFVTPQPDPEPAPPMPVDRPAPDRQTVLPPAGDIQGWRSFLQTYVPDNLKDDPAFLNAVVAGAHAESKLDPNADQPDGNGHGIFQFDSTPGTGALGEGLTPGQLHDPVYQAQHIIPEYAKQWAAAPRGLSPAAKASWVYRHAERPYQYLDPNSQAGRNFAQSHAIVSAVPSEVRA